MGAARGLGEVEKGSYYLMGIEFQFCKTKRIMEKEGGNGRTTLRIYLVPLHLYT